MALRAAHMVVRLAWIFYFLNLQIFNVFFENTFETQFKFEMQKVMVRSQTLYVGTPGTKVMENGFHRIVPREYFFLQGVPIS